MGETHEPDRDIRPDEEALEEIRLLFARYRRVARHGMVTEHDEPIESRGAESSAVPALAGR